MSTTIYLAGAMGYYSTDPELACEWRQLITSEIKQANELHNTNFKVFDPTLVENTSHDVVSQNLHYLQKSDILILNMKDLDKSLGSIFEFSYFAIHQKPIIVINAHVWLGHPYMEKFVSMELIDEYEVVDYLVDVYGQ